MKVRSPSLKEVDIVELVKFDGELECGLQVGHGVCEQQARARAARRAMPRPLPGRGAHGAAHRIRGTARTALHDHTRLASSTRAPDHAPAGTDVRRAVPEPGIHFLIASSAHAPRPSRT
ncbi:hypothetical protein B5X24_HaOG205717 [Helicoverpa armigera]|uniref:Uncharacterized protein n=1 Tax=Helicoverpa armigera TaxID=29058 RepID=A0A2W1BVF7_HELAM|nr:hypothetical protein B5X24_HaOG205717 [Helicoverpa armigera]